MIKFDDYREKYSHILMERQGGILQITFQCPHSERVVMTHVGQIGGRFNAATEVDTAGTGR